MCLSVNSKRRRKRRTHTENRTELSLNPKSEDILLPISVFERIAFLRGVVERILELELELGASVRVRLVVSANPNNFCHAETEKPSKMTSGEKEILVYRVAR